MKEGKHKKESVFELNGGMPPLGQALPLAFQHIVAMIVGCVTPAIIIAGVAGLSGEDKVIIVQAALVVSALATLLQVFPVGFRKGSLQFGAGLPLIVGVGFAYVTSMSTIVEGYGIVMARQPRVLKPAASMTRVPGFTRANSRKATSPRFDFPTMDCTLYPSGRPPLR